MTNTARAVGFGYRLLQKFLRSFFRTFYLLEVKGLERVPADGPVIIAANHINPFDALILAASVSRRMRFVAWSKAFSLPIVGRLMIAAGCIPIDRDKPDLAAFKESLRWLKGNHVLGIFPEGTYTKDGHLTHLKPGTARIALAAQATVVPATLTGAYRAWPMAGPAKQMFPRPWKITLKFHPPIEAVSHQPPAIGSQGTGGESRVAEQPPAQAAVSDQKSLAPELIEKIRAAITQTLEPSLRAEEKVDRLVEQAAPHIRIYE
jgi:1-acyl-sn-glycerol-3-phosphate acyltransferase